MKKAPILLNQGLLLAPVVLLARGVHLDPVNVHLVRMVITQTFGVSTLHPSAFSVLKVPTAVEESSLHAYRVLLALTVLRIHHTLRRMNPWAARLALLARILLQVLFRVHFARLAFIARIQGQCRAQRALQGHMEPSRGCLIDQLHVNSALQELSTN